MLYIPKGLAVRTMSRFVEQGEGNRFGFNFCLTWNKLLLAKQKLGTGRVGWGKMEAVEGFVLRRSKRED